MYLTSADIYISLSTLTGYTITVKITLSTGALVGVYQHSVRNSSYNKIL